MRRHAGYAELRQLRCIKEHGRVRGKDDHRVRLLYEETQKTVVQGAVVSSLHAACCLEADATRVGPASASSLYGSFWADRPSVLKGRYRRLPVARVLKQVTECFGLAARPSHASRAHGREALVGLGGFRLAHDPSQAEYQIAWVAESRAL